MADECDNANDDLEKAYDRAARYVREQVRDMPIGEAGECIRCGEESPRLVNDVCARCRDKFKLR
jgi:tRNA(Ile)-lysidine synthase TilS/MesJ